ncbi:MAG: hydroxyacylglutathione hydrolase [Litoreibacter sp.]|nr:hydroxyacylglutathione hydrolase [Litoreibacter sp.]
MTLKIHQFSYNSDNYGVLVHDPTSRATTCVDAGDAGAVLEAVAETGWSLSELWITHHHWDHVDGLAEVKAKTGCTVTGPDGVKGVDRAVAGGEMFDFADSEVTLIHTPGHTLDMLNYYIADEKIVFTGDTLFVMGCGRLFEGDGPMMWESMKKLMALPPDTTIYCAHEYTLANAEFTLSVDPENQALKAQVDRVRSLRDAGKPTVPTDLATELATNPFLRAGDANIRAQLGMEQASDAEVFTEIRFRKDNF